MDLRVSSDIHIPKALSGLTPFADELFGDISLEFSFTGPTLDPYIDGYFELKDAYLKVHDYVEPVHNIYAYVTLDNTISDSNIGVANIDFISFNHYNSDIYGKGEFLYTGFFDPKGIQVELTNGPFSDPDFKPLDVKFENDLVNFKGLLHIERFKLESDFHNYTISGIVKPFNSKITLNPLAMIPGGDTGSSSSSSSSSSSPPKMNYDSFIFGTVFDDFTVRMGSNVQLEIIGELIKELGDFGAVSFGDITLNEYNQRNSLYDDQIILKGPVSSLNELFIRGSISSKAGNINFLNNTFTIKNAQVLFKSPAEVNESESLSEENEKDENKKETDEEKIRNANNLLSLTNENTLALLVLEAKTNKRYIDDSPVRVTLNYEGPIEGIVDNLFDSLSGEFYSEKRIGYLTDGELAVTLGLSPKDYEKYKRNEFASGGNLIGSCEGDLSSGEGLDETFQNLALNSVDNLFFQRLINSIISSLGFSSALPFTFSIYSSGFRTILSDPSALKDPFNAFVNAFTDRLDIMLGRGFPAQYIMGVPVFENVYVQGGLEFLNFDNSPDSSLDYGESEDRRIYLKAKADIDWISRDSWLINTEIGISYEPLLNLIDLDFGFQFSYKYFDRWFLNTQLLVTYSRYLSDDFGNPPIPDLGYLGGFWIGLGLQFLYYF